MALSKGYQQTKKGARIWKSTSKKCRTCGVTFQATIPTYTDCRSCWQGKEQQKKDKARKLTLTGNITKCGGYVYLIIASNGLTKIGRSKDPDTRIQSIIAASPIELYPLIAFPYQLGHNLEKELHSLFDRKRVKGEWFSLQLDDFKLLFSFFVWSEDHATNRDELLKTIGIMFSEM